MQRHLRRPASDANTTDLLVIPVRAVLDEVDRDDLRARVERAALPCRQSDGSLRFEVTFRFVTAIS